MRVATKGVTKNIYRIDSTHNYANTKKFQFNTFKISFLMGRGALEYSTHKGRRGYRSPKSELEESPAAQHARWELNSGPLHSQVMSHLFSLRLYMLTGTQLTWVMGMCSRKRLPSSDPRSTKESQRSNGKEWELILKPKMSDHGPGTQAQLTLNTTFQRG